MIEAVPRIRMFAGPNGSGKSTIYSLLRPELVGIYINPDDLQSRLQHNGSIEFSTFGITAQEDELRNFFLKSTLLAKTQCRDIFTQLQFSDNVIACVSQEPNSYIASVVADFIRRKLIHQKQSFTFETVMSAADKIQILQYAKQQGYRAYLYYIATEDPSINISRVRNRVTFGGHDVPEDKIIVRYHRSLAQLMEAIRSTDRTYIFDNSDDQQRWIAEITDGHQLEMRTEKVPLWFQHAVLEKVKSE